MKKTIISLCCILMFSMNTIHCALAQDKDLAMAIEIPLLEKNIEWEGVNNFICEDVYISDVESETIPTGTSGESVNMKKEKVPSAYPMVVYNEAYKISILCMARIGTTLTMYYKVKNEGEYTTRFTKSSSSKAAFTLYTDDGDVFTASSDTNYRIQEDFLPTVSSMAKEVRFTEVPKEIKGFTHLIFTTYAEYDQPDSNDGQEVEHCIRNLPIEKWRLKLYW